MSTVQWYMPTCGVAHTNTTTMNHLPDLSPCDFVQFPKVKIKLKDVVVVDALDITEINCMIYLC